ncbi:MAG TPA: hypothetical protein VFD58_01955 [Blastocatellia bacterium]|nr:hypothetical protein [Blastocatellia bacterium]
MRKRRAASIAAKIRRPVAAMMPKAKGGPYFIGCRRGADALVRGRLRPGEREMQAGRPGRIEVRNDEVLLGAPFIFNRGNVDQFDF